MCVIGVCVGYIYAYVGYVYVCRVCVLKTRVLYMLHMQSTPEPHYWPFLKSPLNKLAMNLAG